MTKNLVEKIIKFKYNNVITKGKIILENLYKTKYSYDYFVLIDKKYNNEEKCKRGRKLKNNIWFLQIFSENKIDIEKYSEEYFKAINKENIIKIYSNLSIKLKLLKE